MSKLINTEVATRLLLAILWSEQILAAILAGLELEISQVEKTQRKQHWHRAMHAYGAPCGCDSIWALHPHNFQPKRTNLVRWPEASHCSFFARLFDGPPLDIECCRLPTKWLQKDDHPSQLVERFQQLTKTTTFLWPQSRGDTATALAYHAFHFAEGWCLLRSVQTVAI